MLNKIDKIMLGILLALLLSGGIYWHDMRNIPAEPAISKVEVPAVVEVVAAKAVIPDFGSMVDVKAKKSAFFGFLLPIIQKENDTILQNRKRIITVSAHAELTEDNQAWLLEIAERYGLRDVQTFNATFFQELLNRVDTIPASLALAQSANETGWGTSRFARLGNNFFGQWCFSPGCGIVPESRPEGKTYEVRRFDDVAASVRAYMYNLNTHHLYQGLRQQRELHRERQLPVTGAHLAHGLQAYSTRRGEYVEELLSMINSNKLLQYDLGDQAVHQ